MRSNASIAGGKYFLVFRFVLNICTDLPKALFLIPRLLWPLYDVTALSRHAGAGAGADRHQRSLSNQ